MKMIVAGDVTVGYAELPGLAVSDDSEEPAPTRTVMVVMPNSTGANMCTLLREKNITFIVMGPPDPGFSWKVPLAGTLLLSVAAVVYLRFKNSRREHPSQIST
jgi:hypothetical protein